MKINSIPISRSLVLNTQIFFKLLLEIKIAGGQKLEMILELRDLLGLCSSIFFEIRDSNLQISILTQKIFNSDVDLNVFLIQHIYSLLKFIDHKIFIS